MQSTNWPRAAEERHLSHVCRTFTDLSFANCNARTHVQGVRETMSEVNMPRLSDTMQEGTIARWLKKPGDEIKKGDTLAEIETDKATMDLEAYEEGTLQKILIQEGETVPIGQAVALIGSGAVDQPQKQPESPNKQKNADTAQTTPASSADQPGNRSA